MKSFPVNDNAIAMISNYNTCWLLTENYLYHYNYFGSLLKKIAHDGFTSMRESDGNLILKKDEFFTLFRHNYRINDANSRSQFVNKTVFCNE